MLDLIEAKLEHIVGPSGERTRGLADVVLGVIADAKREQLEQLAAEVLVRMVFDVLTVVQIHQHCGIFEDAQKQITEVPAGVGTEHFVLTVHHPRVPNLGATSREVAMPEQREFLFQRPLAEQHPASPPCRETLSLDCVGPEAEEERVDDRLQSAGFPVRKHPHAH